MLCYAMLCYAYKAPLLFRMGTGGKLSIYSTLYHNRYFISTQEFFQVRSGQEKLLDRFDRLIDFMFCFVMYQIYIYSIVLSYYLFTNQIEKNP